jgi:hypothetical protein
MATQATTQSLAQAPPRGNSAQLEPSINDQTRTLILGMTYDAPAFKDVAEFRAAFELAEQGAHDAAKKMFGNLAELIRYCAMVRSYLSERGANAHLRKEAGIPAGFENWYVLFRAKYDIAWAYKTMLHKIAELEGGCEHCGRLAANDSDHKKSCILYRPLIEQSEHGLGGNGSGGKGGNIEMAAASNAHYADRYKALIGLFTNIPKDASPQEIIATVQAEAQNAYEQLDAETALRITVPRLVKPPDTNLNKEIGVLKEENDALKNRLSELASVPENLRDENITASLAAEPDSGIVSERLRKYLQTMAARALPPHISLVGVSVLGLRFAGRPYRIEIGDWLEKQNTNTAEHRKTLAKCTATAYSKQQMRPKLRDWDGSKGKWGREHMVYDDHGDYRVITETAARELAPGAFEPETAKQEMSPVQPGDWVTFDDSYKYLGRFVAVEGTRFLVHRYDKKSQQWREKPSLADNIQSLTIDEVSKRFPGAVEAWARVQVPGETAPVVPAEGTDSKARQPHKLQATRGRDMADNPRAAASSGALTHPMEPDAAVEEDASRIHQPPAERPDVPQGATGETPDHGEDFNDEQMTERKQPKEEPALFYKRRVLRLGGEEAIDYPVFRCGGGEVPDDVFDTEADAVAYIAKAADK